jgi:hypothetical protein
MGTGPGRGEPVRIPVGGRVFAGVILLLVGFFDIILGLTALFNSGVLVATTTGLIVWDFRAWGLIHVIFGVILALASLGLFSGAEWARWLSVFLAGVNAIAQVAFITAYPLWTVLVVALDVIVIYQLTVRWEYAPTASQAMASQR